MNKKTLSKTWAIVSLVAVLALSLGTVDSAWARGGPTLPRGWEGT